MNKSVRGSLERLDKVDPQRQTVHVGTYMEDETRSMHVVPRRARRFGHQSQLICDKALSKGLGRRAGHGNTDGERSFFVARHAESKKDGSWRYCVSYCVVLKSVLGGRRPAHTPRMEES